MARILSVEDDEHIQHLIGQVLFRDGYEVHYAWNGQEGYEKVLALPPDLILLDLMLPIMNGIELMQKLREHRGTREIPIIIVTAFGDEANMLKCSVEALGAAYYLRKPIDFQELSRCVKAVLASWPPSANGGGRPQPPVRKGAVSADPRLLTVWVEGRLLTTLFNKEFQLLRLLMESPGPVPRPALLKGLGYDTGQGNALKQVMHRLRRDFGEPESRRIRTTAEGYELIG